MSGPKHRGTKMNDSDRIAFYRKTLDILARRADKLVARARRQYTRPSADRHARIMSAQAEYDAWLGLAVLRFPNDF